MDALINSLNLAFLGSWLLVGLVYSIHPRSVNLAIESSFLFDPKEASHNASLINNIKEFIDKLQAALNPNQPTLRQNENKEVLTEFLTEVGITILNYNDEDFSKLLKDFKDIVSTHYETKNFNKVFKSNLVRMYIKQSAEDWINANPLKIKLEIAKYVNNEQTSGFGTFFRNLNAFYNESDIPELKKLSKKFADASKDKKFRNVLSETIEYVIFKRFWESERETRDEYKSHLKVLSKYISELYKKKFQQQSEAVRRVANDSDITVSGSDREDASGATDETTSARNAANNIILDKNLEMDVVSDLH